MVEGRDLFVDDDRLFMKTIAGPMPVDVIYRRLNDDFLDPEALNPGSMLGVAGLMRWYAKGNVQRANPPGTAVADDKAVYAYLPRLVRYFLDQDAISPNVETLICREKPAMDHVLDHLGQMVVKPVGDSAGYGIAIGLKASRKEPDDQRAKLQANPANFIAQPMIDLSVSPTLTDDGIKPRHVDLRPFAVTVQTTWILRGGRSRVALRKGSLVVNSSQGGGVEGHLGPGGGRAMTRLRARYAECIFWMGGYVERAENMARILDVQEIFSRDSRGAHDWGVVPDINADRARFDRRYGLKAASRAIEHLDGLCDDLESPKVSKIIKAGTMHALDDSIQQSLVDLTGILGRSVFGWDHDEPATEAAAAA